MTWANARACVNVGVLLPGQLFSVLDVHADGGSGRMICTCGSRPYAAPSPCALGGTDHPASWFGRGLRSLERLGGGGVGLQARIPPEGDASSLVAGLGTCRLVPQGVTPSTSALASVVDVGVGRGVLVPSDAAGYHSSVLRMIMGLFPSRMRAVLVRTKSGPQLSKTGNH